MSIQDVCHQIQPLDPTLQTKAQTHLGRLTKPLGSLGKLEELATAYVTMTGEL
ncbi:MAG TPA: nicotinate-nucleotide--dimethylbenzimidazole phosphoribosyltransferase, partial [Nitrospira sp.]|nr:nicotinate-nucleotide--dimethylbenzimidazole phosphoribosyltransferase [Nitrospira sp.]